MKYLVTQKLGRAIPRERALDINEGSKRWVQARLEDGTIDLVYSLLDGNAVAIVNAESHDGLFEILMEYPLYWYMDWEFEPLCKWSVRLDKLIELQKQQSS